MGRAEAVLSFPGDAPDVRDVELALIKLDQKAQPRDHLNTDVVAEYAEAMANGAAFPPLVVFFDGAAYWLADGFHRHYAAIGNQAKTFPCDVRHGGLRDAILFSCGANAAHGYKRSNADKRHAVMRLLQDAEWSKWSDREIARQCWVNHHLVSQLRAEVCPPIHTGSSPSIPRTFTHHKTGAPAQMHTANIGGRVREPSALVFDPPPQSPAESLRQNPAFQQDQANGWIWSRLNSIDEELNRLGLSPEDAAKKYPVTLKHAFSKEKALRIAEWFERFADAWRF